MIIVQFWQLKNPKIMKIHTLSLVILGIALASCSSLKVTTDYDSSVNFNRYETYNFTPAADSIPINQLNKKRLFNAISAEMNGNDIQWAAEPDLFVHVHLMLKGRTKTNITYGQGDTYSLGSGFSTTYMDMGEYSQGTLFIDIIDDKRKQLVWSGRVSSAIKDSDPMQEKDINKIVQKVFRNFPPK